MAAKKTWDEVIKSAYDIYLDYLDGKYCYFYGAKGQRLTDSVMNALWDAEPAYFKRYSQAQKKAIFDFSRGKVGYDCSGFIGAITGCNTWSRAQFEQCTEKTTDIYSMPAGAIVYSTFGGTGSHIGIDVGFGMSISFDREGADGVHLYKHKRGNIKWERAGKLTGYIDYDGADNR